MAERTRTITPTVVALSPEANARLERVRRLAWLMDHSIPIGPWRIGLDPIIGLIPGVGDWIGALISTWIIYQGARLGVPNSVLVRMAVNVAIEALAGGVPLLGDVFDAAWQANQRNVRLIEAHHGRRTEPFKPRRVAIWLGLLALALVVIVGVMVVLVARWFWSLVT